MAKRQKQWAKRARAALLEDLGAQCAACGATEQLTFDCKTPMGDKHHRLDTSARMCFYRKQTARGNIQVLCMACNIKRSLLENIS